MAYSTGATLPTSGTNQGSGVAWTNPGNITADDGSVAGVSSGGPFTAQGLFGSGFGFAIPTTATIKGIEVTLTGLVTGAGPIANQIAFLSKDGTTRAGNTITSTLTTTATTVLVGGPTNLWGTTWTASQINASTFSVGFDVAAFSGGGASSMDVVKANIYYTLNNSFTAAKGTFTETGFAATLYKSLRYVFTLVKGAFNLTGKIAKLKPYFTTRKTAGVLTTTNKTASVLTPTTKTAAGTLTTKTKTSTALTTINKSSSGTLTTVNKT